MNARQLALRALRARSLTRAELVDHLARRGVPTEEAHALALELEREGLLSDRLAAEGEARARRKRGDSRDAAQRALEARGVDADLARHALDSAYHDIDPAADALALARQRVALAAPRDPRDRVARRVLAWLARRGHDESQCEDAVRRALDERFGPDDR